MDPASLIPDRRALALLRIAADLVDVPVSRLRSVARGACVVRHRHTLIAALYYAMGPRATRGAIARALHRDHSTVRYAIHRVQQDPELERAARALAQDLERRAREEGV